MPLKQLTLFGSLDEFADAIGFHSYRDLARLVYPHPRYRTFLLSKKLGGSRTIHAPKKKLKELQRRVLLVLQEKLPKPKPAVHGFTPRKSVLTNAQEHLNKTFVFNIDLKDFFPSINFGRIKGLLQAKPFEFPPEVASVIAHICCKDGVLPQGAPTSPLLSNLICRRLDNELQTLAQDCRARYTRYCDDITFSFTVKSAELLRPEIVRLEFGKVQAGVKLESIIEANGFSINHKKVSLNNRAQRMRVTGVTVNEQPNVPRIFIHQIRGMLHAWERYGLDAAQSALAIKYPRQLRSGDEPPFANVVRGKLLYLKMIRGEASPVYGKLATRFNALVQRDQPGKVAKLRVSRAATTKFDVERATFSIELCQDFPGIDAVTSVGSAFLFEGDVLVTCWHVFAPFVKESSQQITFDIEGAELRDFRKRKGLRVTLIGKSEHHDLAILKPLFDVSDYPYLMPHKSSPSVGTLVTMFGFPNFRQSKSVSITNTEIITATFIKSGVKYIEVRDQIRAGNSGGPVVLQQTVELVGVAVEGATQANGDNGVVASSELISLLESLK